MTEFVSIAKRLSQAKRDALFLHVDAIAPILGRTAPARSSDLSNTLRSLVAVGLLRYQRVRMPDGKWSWADGPTTLTDTGRLVLAAALGLFADELYYNDDPDFNYDLGRMEGRPLERMVESPAYYLATTPEIPAPEMTPPASEPPNPDDHPIEP